MAWTVLAAALVSVIASPFARRWFRGETRSIRLAVLLALGAALLSAGYVAYYLRGGPRIVDATSYWLEGRALAEGHLAFGVPDPSAAFRGRFLVSADDGDRLSVIFPPGYPAILAAGFRLGIPLAVGPLIAAALVVATFALCRELFRRNDVALLGALFSTISAALRYHTADTMSHGWSALLMTLVLLASFRARHAQRGKIIAALGGIAGGWLLATRPISGLVALALGAALLLPRPWRSTERRAPDRAVAAATAAAFFLGAIPGVVLLLLHQKAATGSWLGSSQLRYYELSDGPPGCFRYGFGSGVGCLYEHGDFVRARLSDGFGVGEALGTTLRRLHHHALDIANFEPLVVVVLFAVVAGFKHPAIRWLAVAIAGIMVAYLPFYFDGTYPGGGARFYADVLPLEHALLSWGLVRLRAAFVAVPLALVGFSVHGVFSHRALAEREGGRPMFEPEVLERSGISRGLVFVDTDHGFNLGHAPQQSDATRGVVVARWRGDAHDRAVWEVLGRPNAYRYRFDPLARDAVPTLEVQRWSGWPIGLPVRSRGGLASAFGPGGLGTTRVHGAELCFGTPRPSAFANCSRARKRRARGLEPPRRRVRDSAGRGQRPRSGLAGGSEPGSVSLGGRAPGSRAPCWGLTLGPLHLEPGSQRLIVESRRGDVMVDYVDLRTVVESPHPAAQGPGQAPPGSAGSKGKRR